MSKYAVAYCVKGAHIQLTGVSVASLVKNYSSEMPLDIIIISENLSAADIQQIRSIPEIYGKKQISIFVWGPPHQMNNVQGYSNQRFPAVTLWRLFLPYNFPMYEEILYLDNDTIVRKDISVAFNQVKSPNILGAVRDFYFHIINDGSNLSSQFGIADMGNYFNSGFVLFNVAEFTKKVTTDTLLDLINKNAYQYLDQSILNVVAKNQVHYFSFEYNYQKDDRWLYDWALNQQVERAELIEKVRNKVIVRHFVEFNPLSMPWEHLAILDSFEQEFWDYLTELKMRISNNQYLK